MTMTEAQARRLGWKLTCGAYTGTTDDRMDRWYWQQIDSDVVDRRGAGFATKREALEEFALSTEMEEARA